MIIVQFGAVFIPDQASIYDHNALNQIIDITETGAVTRTLTPVWTDGNLTSDGECSFGYDPFNRLTSVTGGGQSDVDLGYDPMGRLAELDVTGGLVTRFQYGEGGPREANKGPPERGDDR